MSSALMKAIARRGALPAPELAAIHGTLTEGRPHFVAQYGNGNAVEYALRSVKKICKVLGGRVKPEVRRTRHRNHKYHQLWIVPVEIRGGVKKETHDHTR